MVKKMGDMADWTNNHALIQQESYDEEISELSSLPISKLMDIVVNYLEEEILVESDFSVQILRFYQTKGFITGKQKMALINYLVVQVGTDLM